MCYLWEVEGCDFVDALIFEVQRWGVQMVNIAGKCRTELTGRDVEAFSFIAKVLLMLL